MQLHNHYFFLYKTPWSSNFLTKKKDSVPWLPGGKPVSPTLSTQAEPSIFLSYMTSFKLLGGWEGPQPKLPYVRASSVWVVTAEAGGTRAGISTWLPTTTKHVKKPHRALRAPLQILYWVEKWEIKSLRGSCLLVIPCALSLTKGIHSPSSSLPVLPASESLLSVMWILFTSLIFSCHQLMNKLFISKFINYSTSSIDDWIILTK